MTFRDVFRWQARIKAIERQYLAVRAAVERMLIDVAIDPSLLVGDLRPRDLEAANEALEDTYVVRMLPNLKRHFARLGSRLARRCRQRGCAI